MEGGYFYTPKTSGSGHVKHEIGSSAQVEQTCHAPPLPLISGYCLIPTDYVAFLDFPCATRCFTGYCKMDSNEILSKRKPRIPGKNITLSLGRPI
jgi:hypothetical protein